MQNSHLVCLNLLILDLITELCKQDIPKFTKQSPIRGAVSD